MAQINAYQAANVPMALTVVACMIIARRHNKFKIKIAMNDWWSEIIKYSREIKLAFNI